MKKKKNNNKMTYKTLYFNQNKYNFCHLVYQKWKSFINYFKQLIVFEIMKAYFYRS